MSAGTGRIRKDAEKDGGKAMYRKSPRVQFFITPSKPVTQITVAVWAF